MSPKALIGNADIVVKFGNGRRLLLGDGAFDECDGRCKVTALAGQDPEEVERINLVWNLCQDLPIKRFGLIQAAGAMMAASK